MYALLALLATVLTSFLPILSKSLLRDTRTAQVAWAINAASLPLLAAGTLFLTQCSIMNYPGSAAISCTTNLPRVDGIFLLALLGSAVLNGMATLFSTVALAKADASLVSPLLTFNPAFTLLLAWPALGEVPGLCQTIGVAIVLLGAYVLDLEEARTGALAPLRVLVERPGTLLALARRQNASRFTHRPLAVNQTAGSIRLIHRLSVGSQHEIMHTPDWLVRACCWAH